MKQICNPEQNWLFDYYETHLSEVAYKRLKTSFHSVFRHVVLSLMPAEELGEHFHEALGRPTKELYSMAGLILLREFHDWTEQETVDAYLFDTRVQYALNLGADNLSFSERTLERYEKLVRENELAGKIFTDVTNALIKELDLEVDRQRLDSTHIFSDMATFSRTKLMGVTIKRFLVQLKRHYKDLYDGLPEELRQRYERTVNALFADYSKEKEKRHSLRQEVAEQMYFLVKHFSGVSEIENMSSFKHLVSVFTEQCELKGTVKVEETEPDETGEAKGPPQKEQEVVVKKKTGGNVIQNPSDPDATYDGHKGVGYQAQLSETSSPKNEVQLITSVIPETAADPDSAAVDKVLDDLEKNALVPERMTADTLYGSDENVQNAKGRGVDLISPVSGKTPEEEIENPTEKQSRLEARRKAQESPEWREEYNSRAQIEGTIGSVKRKTGLGELRYRGKSSVFAAIYLKMAGWNISRYAASCKIQGKRAMAMARTTQIDQINRTARFFKLLVAFFSDITNFRLLSFYHFNSSRNY